MACNIVAQTTENTVVTEYKPVARRSDFYQSEADLEKEFIIRAVRPLALAMGI